MGCTTVHLSPIRSPGATGRNLPATRRQHIARASMGSLQFAIRRTASDQRHRPLGVSDRLRPVGDGERVHAQKKREVSMAQVKAIPDGYSTVTQFLNIKGAA